MLHVTMHVSSRRFIGRGPELSMLRDRIVEAERGTASFVLVGGEAGVGKTRIVDELADQAATDGVLVLSGGCMAVGEGGGLPFAPFVQALRRLPAILARDPIGKILGIDDLRTPATVELGRLLPEFGTPVTRPLSTLDGPNWVQGRIFEGTLAVLRQLGDQVPVLLILEDLQWADTSTRDLGTFLASNARTERLVMVGTYRTDDLHRRHPLRPWLSEMDRSPIVQRFELPRFERTQVVELLTSILDRPPVPSLVDAVARRTDGNAFFVEELVAAGLDDADHRIPDTLREVMLSRVGALSEEAQRVLGIAATDPGPIDPARIAIVAGLSEEDVEGPLHEALAAQLVVQGPGFPTGGYRFRHALLAEAILDDLLPSERRRFHAAFAADLADRPIPPGAEGASQLALLAHHATGAHQPVLALRAWVGAARAARSAYAAAEALASYDQALAIWDTVNVDQRPADADLAALFQEASVVALIAGRPERGVELARLAVAALDPATDARRWALAADGLGRACWIAGEQVEGVRSLEHAASVLDGAEPSGEYARVLGTLSGALMLQGDHERAIAVAEAAITMARDVGDPIAEANAVITLGSAQAFLGRCEEGIATLRVGMELTRGIDAVDILKRAYANLSAALSLCGDNEESFEVAREGALRSRALGAWSQYGRFVATNAVDAAIDLGRWDEADALLDEICATELTGVLRLAIGANAGIFWARRGRFTAAETVLADARSMVVRLHEAQFTGPIFVGLVELALSAGRPADAAALGAEGLERVGETNDLSYLLDIAWMTVRAEADLADQSRARRAVAASSAAATRAAEVADAMANLLPSLPEGAFGERVKAFVAMDRAEAARAAGMADIEAWRSAVAGMDAIDLAWPMAYARYRLGEAMLGAHAARGEVVEDPHGGADTRAPPGSTPAPRPHRGPRAASEDPAPRPDGPGRSRDRPRRAVGWAGRTAR